MIVDRVDAELRAAANELRMDVDPTPPQLPGPHRSRSMLAAGALFVETLFGIPGIGQLSLEAVQLPDFDVVLALILFGSASFVLANVVIDVAYAFIDPRVRVGGARG